MQIETTIEKKIKYLHGSEIKVNDVVLIHFGNKDLVGMYKGITKHGSLAFHSLVEDVSFNVMPSSVKYILPAKVDYTKEDI